MCQLVWEVQLVKVQQQVICNAGTESCFIEQFCSSVILMPQAIRRVYMVSVLLHAELACVCAVLQSWKKVAVGLLVQKGLFWSLSFWENLLRTGIWGTGPAACSLVTEVP